MRQFTEILTEYWPLRSPLRGMQTIKYSFELSAMIRLDALLGARVEKLFQAFMLERLDHEKYNLLGYECQIVIEKHYL